MKKDIKVTWLNYNHQIQNRVYDSEIKANAFIKMLRESRLKIVEVLEDSTSQSDVDHQMREHLQEFIEKFSKYFDPDFETQSAEMIEYITEVMEVT